MATTKYSNDIFSLLDEYCTKEQIHALLKPFGDHDKVRLTGNKPEMINVHLRNALDAGVFPVDRVYDLIREGEENGHQFIYYYEPATSKVKLSLDEVGARLFGTNWQAKMKFPRFELKPEEFLYADLRQWDTRRKPHDWALKIYGQQLLERQSDEERIDERTVRRTYVLEPHRLVILVRWNNPNVLEIRVPSHAESKKRARQWLDTAWTMIKRVFTPDNFKPWDLCPARANLVSAPKEKYAEVFKFSHSRLEDEDHNVVSYSAAHTDRDLRSSTNVVNSMKGIGGQCKYLRVTWLPTKDEVITKELVTSLGSYEVNELLIGRQCTAQEVEYVTNQLRDFGRLRT